MENLLNKNYFELFGLAPDFTINLQDLKQKQQALLKIFHPDKVQKQSDLVDLALKTTTHINKAYFTLSELELRAIYLLKVNSHPLNLVTNTKYSQAFLFKQMTWREEIEEASNKLDQLFVIEEKLIQEIASYENGLSRAFHNQNYQQAQTLVSELSFFNKLLLLVNNKIHELT